ncbi:MAG: Panacea domain-containing protein [Dehalococcoidia bacterium]
MPDRQLDEKKFTELVLYVADKCESDPRFGTTKLNKILYFADFTAYVDFGQSITGAKYKKRPYGPLATPMVPIQKELEMQGDLKLKDASWYGYPQKKPVSLRPANLSLFSGPEIALVDRIIDSLKGLDASQVTYLSHQDWGWKLAAEGEVIPIETAFIEEIETVEPAD